MYRFTILQHNAAVAHPPPLDIVETTAGYQVKVDLPGVDKENLSVNVKENVLTIEAESQDAGAQNAADKPADITVKRERRSGKWYRALRLGRAVDADNIHAEYQNGVLTLTVPHAAELAVRKIAVN